MKTLEVPISPPGLEMDPPGLPLLFFGKEAEMIYYRIKGVEIFMRRKYNNGALRLVN